MTRAALKFFRMVGIHVLWLAACLCLPLAPALLLPLVLASGLHGILLAVRRQVGVGFPTCPGFDSVQPSAIREWLEVSMLSAMAAARGEPYLRLARRRPRTRVRWW